MTDYVRPVVQEREFHDADGRAIQYGKRWGMSGPPDDTYSVTSNLERFAPLHDIAAALIVHLVARYDVELTAGAAHAEDLMTEMDDIVRTFRLTPADPASAPLTIVLSGFPGVVVHAGLLHDFEFPPCGCDACDESWEGQAQTMEWHVLAVAAGKFRENVIGRHNYVGFSIDGEDGSASGGGGPFQPHGPLSTVARVDAARARLAELPNGWAPWPLRAPSGA